jgi:hypothetical protein
MSDKPLPFSNGLNLKPMGAVMLLIMGVLVWQIIHVHSTTYRVLAGGAIAFEILFFVFLVYMSRKIRNQYRQAQTKANRLPDDDATA